MAKKSKAGRPAIGGSSTGTNRRPTPVAPVRTNRPPRGQPAPTARRFSVGPATIIGAIVVAVTLVIGFALLNSGGSSAAAYSCGQQVVPQQGATVANPMVMAEMGRTHVRTGSEVEYLNCPPTSGNHYSAAGIAPLPAGYYAPDAPYGPGNWVHSLEHGYTVVLYRCAGGVCPSEADVAELRRFVAEAPATQRATACNQRNRVIVARFDQMSTPYAFLAWNRLLLEESFDRSTALDFARTWTDVTGPEASC